MHRLKSSSPPTPVPSKSSSSSSSAPLSLPPNAITSAPPSFASRHCCNIVACHKTVTRATQHVTETKRRQRYPISLMGTFVNDRSMSARHRNGTFSTYDISTSVPPSFTSHHCCSTIACYKNKKVSGIFFHGRRILSPSKKGGISFLTRHPHMQQILRKAI